MVLSVLLSCLISLTVVSVIFLVVLKKRTIALEDSNKKAQLDLQELQKKLQIKEYQLNEIQGIGAVGSFIWNLSDNAIILSDEMYRLCGQPPQNKKITSEEFLLLVHPEDRQTMQAKLSEAKTVTKPFEHTFRILYPDTSVHWLKAKIRTMHSDKDMPLQIIGMVQDTTEVQERDEHLQLKTSELLQKVGELEQARNTMQKLLKELNAERAKDGAILSSIGDGVIATDDAGKIIFINPKAESLLGIRLIKVMGKDYDSTFAEYDEKGILVPSQERPIWQTLHSGQIVSVTSHLYEKEDKTRFPVSTSIAPILLNGKTIGAIDVFRDITHEKDIDRMKTEFISLASHQLRTPLSAIKWFLQILADGDVGALTKEQAEIVDNINQSNERMIDLVNSLLNVSRIESGRIIVDPELTDLRQLVKEVEGEIQPKLIEKKQVFTFNAPEDLPKISVDPKLIRQVYMNLLTNAIKYTPDDGHITVSISKNDTEFISEVSDTGYGIPAKDQDKVFGKFYRGENITTVETDGNGLGLYLVKAIIESSNGKIWYKSEERKGTTFWFSLPITGMQAKSGEVVLG